MFSALRQNSIVYILDKRNVPEFKKGIIVSVSSPRAKTNTFYGLPANMVVDLEVKIDNNTETFKDIPSGLSLANDGSISISETKEALCSEVESIKASNKQVIDSVPFNEKSYEACERILEELNPQLAKEKALEQRINMLENKLGNVESSLSNITTMLSQALNKNN